MKAKLTAFSVAAGFLAFGLLGAAQAAEIYVVHGINGEDLGASRALPVDVAVNGGCLLQDVELGAITDAIEVDAGSYDIDIFLATAGAGCSGPLAVTETIDVQLTESASVVAHLTEQGTPTLTKFVNDLQALPPWFSTRLIVRHAAAAPPVDVISRQGLRAVVVPDIRNGEQRSAEVGAGHRRLIVQPFRQNRIGPIPTDLEPGTATVVYAIGSLKNGTFEPLVQVLRIP
jgi:hypothetical protein